MFEKIDPKALDQNVFSLIGDQWMLITAGTKDQCNTMTASWGGLGVLWGKPVATVYIRPQRYTLEFVEREDTFTLCFFGEGYRKALALCGSKSGRDMDKVKECGFTVATAEGAPYFEEADLVLVCKKSYWQDMDPTHFLDGEIDSKWYPEKDYHRIFIGEILEVLRKV
ncbi:flavin reductase family protein [uncultured Flavonifractor sp.]|uniref:flavin reductase family protein n=1 Tax=uncultured Flavonifractor sp. TaxID=1193534 RepID=UPI00266FD438|nr:flavin reductase family protein [uncultured Flavonifractor sp.]